MTAFVTALALNRSALLPHGASTASSSRPLPSAAPARVTMVAPAGYSARVDEFFANDVRRQYIAKACPSGVATRQCIEGTTSSEPYDSRTLKRQSQLRFRQLPISVQVHNMYENRKNALIACHGCSHEEERVLSNPALAASMLLGQAEADKACSRYMVPNSEAEKSMVRSVENTYMKAVNPGGVFSTACTDGQAKYEAYLASVRGGSVAFRAKQYSPAEAAHAKFAARKRAVARTHVCNTEDKQYVDFPMVAGSMRPAFGYYQPFVQSFRQPEEGGGEKGMKADYLIATVRSMTSSAVEWFTAKSGGMGGY